MNIIFFIKISVILLAGFAVHPGRAAIPIQAEPADKGNTATSDTLPAPALGNDQRLPPHTARVKAKILDLEGDADQLHLHLKVIEILGYGAATPVLGTGRALRLDAGSFFLTSNRSKEWIEPGVTAVVLIDHTPAMEMTQNASDWSLVDIKMYRQPD